MNPRAARTLRGLAAGGTATLVAAVSHGLAGGTFPGVAGMGLALAFSAIVGIAFAGRGLSVVRLAASIVLSQAAFHVLFSTMGGAGEVVQSGHHGTITITDGAQAMTHASPLMWVAHAVAAALTLIALVFGERALDALRETARMLLAALLSPTSDPQFLPFTRSAGPRVDEVLVPRSARDLIAACGLRGPPRLLRSA